MFKIPFLSQTKEVVPTEGSKHKMIVGLGNPDEKYEKTYHNVGHMYVDHLAKNLGLSFKKYKSFEYAKSPEIILVKPTSYMNRSGLGVTEALKHFNLNPRDTIVAHDDVDIPLGQYKLSHNKGDAGHKGVKSIIDHLKTKDFYRLRIGIGKDRQKAGDFVLERIRPQELEIIEKLFSEIETIYREGDGK